MPFDFKKIKEPVTKSMVLTLEIELINSHYTPDEAAEKLQYLINSSNAKEFSELIVFLLRTTRSSMWELKKLELV
jgi:hypothetical protein